MRFRDYYLSLSAEEREAYATRAGTTVKYLPQLTNERPFKVPKDDLLRRLAEASEGNVSLEEVLSHFFSQPRHKGPRRQKSTGADERTGNERKVAAAPDGA